jgi:hypothetical protein
VIREDRELLAELARLNSDMASLGLALWKARPVQPNKPTTPNA